MIALQYCVDFYHTSTWIIHKYTYVSTLWNHPPTSHPIPPLFVVTEHGFELPEEWIVIGSLHGSNSVGSNTTTQT